VLSTTGEGEAAPTRATGGLDGLIDGVRSAGYDVTTEVVGNPRPLAPELDAVAFRVLQEMLTNSLKHGSREGGSIVVAREWDSRELRIEVTNPIPHETASAADAGLGLGLVGMQRRLESVGGRLMTGASRSPDGRAVFTATAWVPIRDRGDDR
jgi:signal transduction histidine kinase